MGSRVPVVTGLGVVSSAGIGAGRFWEGLFTSEHHFREITLFKPDGLPNRMASEIGPWVPGFEDLDETLLAQSRITAFAAVALREALARSGTEASSVDRVLVGTTCGDIASQEASIRAARVDGYDEPMRLRVDSEFRASLSTHCADVHVELLVTACSAGNLAAIRAAQMIEAGEADVVVAGGAEAFSRMAFVGFARMRGMAAEQCRPFSEARDGLLLGEGAAFAVLESAEHAAARGAVPLAEVSGYGMSCDAKHPAAPDATGTGVARAMRAALRERQPSDVDFVCAHGTGTPQNDAAEARAYSTVFTDSRPPISSIKGSIGHSLGAASAIELVACVLSIQHQRLVPHRGIGDDPALDVHLTSEHEPPGEIDFVLNNSFAFGGNNTCVALSKATKQETTEESPRPVGVWSYTREYAAERTEVLSAVERVFESGQLIMGQSLAGFEAEYAAYHGAAHCIGVDNGTNAIALSLRALGVGANDEVITVSNTAAPTVVAIDAIGARPVLVDIEDNGGYLVDVSAIEAAITPKTKCIVVVHLFGQIADMKAIVELARARGLALLEDCAQAHGATHHGKMAGTFGDIAAFSFYPTKILGAYGDGGAVITDDKALADRVRQYRYYGMKERYFVEDTPGFNCRLDEVQAEILRGKLKKLPDYLKARREIAARYVEGLSDTSLQLPAVLPGNDHAFYIYVVRHPQRDRIMEALKDVDIRLNISYPYPIHLMTGFRHLGMKVGDLPHTERAANEIFSLPMYPYLRVDDQARVIHELRRILASL